MVLLCCGVKLLIDFDECLRLGLLRRIPASEEKAKNILEKANNMLTEAKSNFRNRNINSAVIMSYIAILNAGRAVLFRDGFREKSHACIARYLGEKYVKKGKLAEKYVLLLDRFRTSRHATQYDATYYPTKDEAEQILAFADDFIGQVEKL